MIGKKPFRVTNEKARFDKSEHIFAGQGGSDKSKIKDYASDLLDSREFIDKQEAIIKELRELHEKLSLYNLDYMVISQINDILEKTKEYA